MKDFFKPFFNENRKIMDKEIAYFQISRRKSNMLRIWAFFNYMLQLDQIKQLTSQCFHIIKK